MSSVDDPDDFYGEADRRERARAARRASRRERRRPTLPDSELRHLAATPAGRVLIWTVAAIAAFTLVGLVALWPGPVHHHGPSQSFGGPTQTATVTGVYDVRCGGPVAARCRQIQVSVDGRRVRITLGPVQGVTSVSVGDTVRVSRVILRPGVKPLPGSEPYQFLDIDRQGSMLTLGLALLALAVLLLWWRGMLAAIGVGLSLLLVTQFLVPALLTGGPPLLVALVGALAVMFVTLVLTNGIGAQTLAAALGITTSLLLICLLAGLAIGLGHLDGHSTDVSLALTQQNAKLSLRGVVLAGMVIGALGALTDTAVTQASAIMALRRANPGLGARGLYRGAFAVGRDHLSATIHTLVLAYVGAALPLLLVLRSTGLAAADAVNAQSIAEPILATIVGCIGLIAAVPLTTGLAAMLAVRLPGDALPDGHGHAH